VQPLDASTRVLDNNPCADQALVVRGEFRDGRASSFSYTCNRCLHCCYSKRIQLNPYEVARLARSLGETTREFREKWTIDGAGIEVLRTQSGACVFLGPDGCTVHSDRPLVCRLYPLGRKLGPDGTEEFVRLTAHPESTGIYETNGTITEFLESQAVASFIKAADDYYELFCRLHSQLADGAENGFSETADATTLEARELLDIDTAVKLFCERAGSREPSDIEERKNIHLKVLYAILSNQR